MIFHHIKTTFRNLNRNRLNATLNVFGLSLGLTIGFIILSWTTSELKYDKFHTDYDRIFRLVAVGESDDGNASFSPVAKEKILDQVTEVKYAGRIFKGSQIGISMVEGNDHVFTHNEIYFADPGFFDIFSFPLLKGNPELIFEKPNSVAITEKTAELYFGDEDPIGKTLLIEDRLLLEVVGVLQEVPAESHFHFDLLTSMQNHPWADFIKNGSIGSTWMFYTYCKLFPEANPQTVIDKANQIVDELSPNYNIDLQLQPIADIHLRSALDGELEANKDIRYIYIFSSIALLVIIIAGINYVNLATAHSFERSREVGIRKVLGAHKKQLVYQHLGESLIISMMAMTLAFIFIELIQWLILPSLQIGLSSISFSIQSLLFLAGITISVGLVSGIVPSIMISSFNPMKALKSNAGMADKTGGLRRILVIAQFSISLLVALGTVAIYQQLNFLQDKKLGYDKDQVLMLNVGYHDFQSGVLKNSLLSDSRIINASIVNSPPTNIDYSEYIDVPVKKGGHPQYLSDNKHWAHYISVDHDFFKTMNINILSGREAVESLTSRHYENKYVLNQAALKDIGWSLDEAINQQIIIRHGNMEPGPVIGVVEDFHFQSLHYDIRPLVIEFGADNEYLLVKLSGENIGSALSFIEAEWKDVAGDIPFEYSFLDQEYNQLYKSETTTGRLFIGFAIFSIIIAMLGLFGLASYASIKRTKEIGIRKVNGANLGDILLLLNKDFVRWIIISFMIASPAAYFFIDKWLESFAYKTTIGWWIFLVGGVIAILITLLTVSWQSWKAARKNPVEALRYE